MNLDFNYSALVVYLVIIFSMILRNVVKGHTSKTYFLLVLVSVFSTFIDVLSEWRFVTPSARFVLNNFYFVGLMFIPLLYSLYIYSSIGLSHYLKTNKKLQAWYFVPGSIFIATLVVNAFTKKAFWVNEAGYFQQGPLSILMSIAIVLYLLTGIFTIVRWNRIIEIEKLLALSTFFPIVVSSMLFEHFHNSIEMVLFGIAISELIISFAVQRNDENFDKVTGIKNYESAIENFQKVFLTKQQVSIIYVKIKNQNAIKHFLGTTAYNRFIKLLCHNLVDSVKKYATITELYYIHEEIYSLKISTVNMKIVREIAGAIYKCLEKNLTIGNISISIDKKLCIVRIPDDIDNFESLMNFRLNFYNKLPDTNEVLELANYIDSKEFKIKNELDEIVVRALNDNHLQMYYQPIYSVKEKKFTSAEALIRLNDPKYGFISPAIFIPAAESTGAIHQIGDFVNESVCRFISKQNLTELGLNYIELNLSVNQCIEEDLVEKIQKLTANYKISSDQLNFEITETDEGFNPAIMDKNINALYKKGFTFSLDDYGTGYSNIKRLTALPLDIVKLDKSFVDEMDDPQMWTVIVNTINMFKEMNKTILVEGVEDEKKMNALVDLGCDYIQGYYFSKPLPESQFVEFLKNNNTKAG